MKSFVWPLFHVTIKKSLLVHVAQAVYFVFRGAANHGATAGADGKSYDFVLFSPLDTRRVQLRSGLLIRVYSFRILLRN